MGLRLKVTDWVDATKWRWELQDQAGTFIADHQVRLDPVSPQYQGFCDLTRHLDYHSPLAPPQVQLAQLGAWVGEQVFGGLRAALRERARQPGEVVQVHIPPVAEALLGRPFELACFADGLRFDEAGLRLAYQADGAVASAKADGRELRLLAVFSLPVSANPLNLRRERHELQRLVRRLRQTHHLAIELRVLQYGATRETLREALEEAEGWDVIHLSGHGHRGELLLETDDGGEDPIDTLSLGRLLEPVRGRLRLLLLDACYSGAASHAAARAQVGLEATRDASGTASSQASQATPLPSLGHVLAAQLDCAVLAMRYPVDDGFATDLILALYEKLLHKRQPLPAALQMALDAAHRQDLPPSELARLTPVLLGARAGSLQLSAPKSPGGIELPTRSLSIGFPSQPDRFVGRLQPMLRASRALAPHSLPRAVLFHGMPGAGKTACALELAYRHEHGRFTGHVWYQAPEAGSEIQSVVFHLMHEIQRQLNAPQLQLTTALEDPTYFREYTLPRLRGLLEDNALLIVLDNLETLLTDSDQWRVPLFGEVLEALLSHRGLSHVVLTSRRVPAALARDERVVIEPIHALSFAESVLLARELKRLRRLFTGDANQALLRRTLRVVQGHPKMMELADGLADDHAALVGRVEAAERQLAGSGDLLDAFFASGGDREGESLQPPERFMQSLHDWTHGVLAGLTPEARQLFAFLCRLEPEHRGDPIARPVWRHVVARLQGLSAPRAEDVMAADNAFRAATPTLRATGLLDVERLFTEDAGKALHRYNIHPGVAEAALASTDADFLRTVDQDLGDFFQAVCRVARDTELEGRGHIVATAAKSGVPYLMRAARWHEAAALLEQYLHREFDPDAVSYALPLLERIAVATVGTELELLSASVHARTLGLAHRREEAQHRLRELLAQARSTGRHGAAASISGDLATLLSSMGRLDQALDVLDGKVEDVRKAGLGRWSQLAVQGQRLQMLAASDRDQEEVLETVRQLIARMEELSVEDDEEEAEDSSNRWNVRELILDTGRTAETGASQWEAALALNQRILESKLARRAGRVEIARSRFNDYAALLRLDRVEEARDLLTECRAVFEELRDPSLLGNVYSALADLENTSGSADNAIAFERLALAAAYRGEGPEACDVSHHNLSNYLERTGAAAELVLAHRLAAALLISQTRAGRLRMTLEMIASRETPSPEPTFADVARQVEQEAGVRFAELFARLPKTFATGDDALAAIWAAVRELRKDPWEDMPDIPMPVRESFALDGAAFSDALREALQALPAEEGQRIVQRLRDAGYLS